MWILQGHLYGLTRTVQVKSGMSIDSHPESYVLVATASPYSPGKYVNWNLSFSMEILYISYGELFKVTCTAIQELYRSSLVCPLILIRRATFWSERLVRTVLGSMLTGIWVFSMEILYSYVNSSRSPVRPYKNCTGQVWYVHWFPSGELRFGPNG